MGSSGGMSQREIYETQKKAREDAERAIQKKQADEMARAQAGADAGSGKDVGGEGTSGGVLSEGKKRKSTLAGEGEAVFSRAGKLGE